MSLECGRRTCPCGPIVPRDVDEPPPNPEATAPHDADH